MKLQKFFYQYIIEFTDYYSQEPSLMEGKVKWFSREKGYGFITADSGEDHYFNVRSIKGAELPVNGDRVCFDSHSGNKGLCAVHVVIVEKGTVENKQDDRIKCPACDKRIVPRLITYRGRPQKSVCPYCAATVKEFSQCFIATAVYGDANCDEVLILRQFRDEKLLTNRLGKQLVALYYFVSPPVAQWLTSKPGLSLCIKHLLDRVVRLVRTEKA